MPYSKIVPVLPRKYSNPFPAVLRYSRGSTALLSGEDWAQPPELDTRRLCGVLIMILKEARMLIPRASFFAYRMIPPPKER